MSTEKWTSKRVDKFNIANKILGEGSYGKVYLAYLADDETKLAAAKVIQIQNITDSPD